MEQGKTAVHVAVEEARLKILKVLLTFKPNLSQMVHKRIHIHKHTNAHTHTVNLSICSWGWGIEDCLPISDNVGTRVSPKAVGVTTFLENMLHFIIACVCYI